MTFSVIAFDPDNGDLGIAVASKFPNIGVVTPFAKAGVGAVATQSYINTGFGPKGLALLENGASAQQALDILIANDTERDDRQVGIIDAQGRAATFTGNKCFAQCGGLSGDNFAVQGNVMASQAVLDDMAETLKNTAGLLTERLLAALRAGQAAGGDRRGQQSAALLVVRVNGGYGGHDDRYASISVYDHPTPVEELFRLYALHRLTYFRPDKLVPITPELAAELQHILRARGFLDDSPRAGFDAVTKQALHDFMGWENYDNRMRDDDLIDLEVLADMRQKNI
jgi:uncharacterized Ntn-hydrolase superfamily protein